MLRIENRPECSKMYGARLSPDPEVMCGYAGAGSDTLSSLGAEVVGGMESERWDSNPRPPAPKAGALPDCATLR